MCFCPILHWVVFMLSALLYVCTANLSLEAIQFKALCVLYEFRFIDTMHIFYWDLFIFVPFWKSCHWDRQNSDLTSVLRQLDNLLIDFSEQLMQMISPRSLPSSHTVQLDLRKPCLRLSFPLKPQSWKQKRLPVIRFKYLIIYNISLLITSVYIEM